MASLYSFRFSLFSYCKEPVPSIPRGKKRELEGDEVIQFFFPLFLQGGGG
jgi:hypothetical protein